MQLSDAYPDLLNTKRRGDFVKDDDLLNSSYHLSVDGLSYSTLALYRPLMLRRLMFKQSGHPYAFFRHGLREFEHYIPVQDNLDDLVWKVRWARENTLQATKIAVNGARFAHEFLFQYGRLTSLRYLGALLRAYAVRFPEFAVGFDPEKLEAVEQINNSWMETDHFKSYFGASLEVKAT